MLRCAVLSGGCTLLSGRKGNQRQVGSEVGEGSLRKVKVGEREKKGVGPGLEVNRSGQGGKRERGCQIMFGYGAH